MTLERRNSFVFSLAAMACALLYGYLAFVSRDVGDATLVDLAIVIGGSLLAIVTLALITDSTSSIDVRLLLGWALLLRVLAALAYPTLEDDFFRYLWDGARTLLEGTPYGTAPASFFGAAEGLNPQAANALDGINHPQIATVYGPTLQLVFAASQALMPWSLTPLKVLLVGADLGVLLLLWRLAPGRACWWWALSPLLLKEFANTAHPDLLGAACVVVALWALHRSNQGVWWAPGMLGVAAGLAIGVKPIALVIVPFLLLHVPGAWPWCGAALMALTLCFWPASSPLEIWLPEGLRAMGEGWTFNAPLHRLALFLGLPAAGTKATLLAGYALLWFWALWLHWRAPTRPVAPTLLWLVGVFWLIVPALNPWYLVWWLPFAVLRPAATPWFTAAAVLLSYLTPINTGLFPPEAAAHLYAVPGWVLAAELVLVGVGLALDRRYWLPAIRSSL